MPAMLNAIPLPEWQTVAIVLAALAVGIAGTLYLTRHGRRSRHPAPRPRGVDAGGRSRPVPLPRPEAYLAAEAARQPPEVREAVLTSRPIAPAARETRIGQSSGAAGGDDRLDALQATVEGLRSELLAVKRKATEVEEDHHLRIVRMEAQLRPPPGRAAEPWRDPAPPPSAAPAVETAVYDPSPGGYGAPPAAVQVPYGALPAEVKDDVVRTSDSYPPEAYLATGSPARLYLNAEIKLSEAAVRRFQAFFDFPPLQGNSASYRTRTPAEVEWNGTQGTCRGRGTVEAL